MNRTPMRALPRKQDPTGIFNLLRRVARERYGDPAGLIQGRGQWPHKTRKGPGRRATPSSHPAGTKLVRRFIRQSASEQVEYRRIYARLCGGRQLNTENAS